jgi:hypothetical protein
MMCYADDTLVVVGGRWWGETVNLTEAAVACAVNAIQRLGLRMSPAKSEALWFFNQRRRGTPPPGLLVSINEEDVPVRCEIKYLGLAFDSHWTFGSHFELPENDGRSQRVMRHITEHRRNMYGSSPTLRGSDPVPSPLWGSYMGRRLDGEPS